MPPAASLRPAPAARARSTRILCVLLAALLLAASLPAASVVSAQKVTSIGLGAEFLPQRVGLYVGVNLSPDDVQSRSLQRLVDYYMQDPQIAAMFNGMMSDAPSGMTPQELVDGLRSWTGGEAFV